MGIGIGMLLVAVGAVLTFALTVTDTHGFNLHTMGVILMVVGGIGLLIDLAIFMPRRRMRTITEERTDSGRTDAYPTKTERRVVRDREDVY